MQLVPPSTAQISHQLPNIATSFIGCEPAIATVKTLLTRTHLLTLTGGGGSGKTRLALAVASDYAVSAGDEGDAPSLLYPDGVAWVDLAPVADPALVAQSVADVLYLREQPNRSYTDLIVDHLCDRRLLLVLDNCEHLRAACADLLTRLLQAGVLARILATSREPLAIPGEEVWLVPMLSVPTLNGHHAASPARLDELLQSEAVRLFDARARAVAPSFQINAQNAEAIAQICHQLDGMPLAIELAAARVNVLMPRQIVARLENSLQLLTRGSPLQSRHQTLRAALDWSFDLLPAHEGMLFTRLSIFAGSFGLDAVEGICAGEGLAVGDLLDLLAGLVEKSLVVASETNTPQLQEMRYRLLVPVRHYATEQLRVAHDENVWRARHATYYLQVARRAAPELEGAEQHLWLDRLESEHDNLRVALTWYASTTDGVEAGLHLSSYIGLFWCIRNYLSEGQRWLEHFLHHLTPQIAPQAQVDALNSLARLAVLQSNFQAARITYERSLVLGRELEYDFGVETGLIGYGVALWELGEFQNARHALEEAVRYARAANHERSLARALNNLGLICMHQGDNPATRAALQESLVLNQRLGHKTGIATVLFNLALLAKNDNDFVRARLRYEEAMALNRELGNRSTVADTLNNLGGLASAQGDFALATTRYLEADQLYRDIGALGDTGYTLAGLGDVAFFKGDYASARTRYAEALNLFREAGNQRLISRVLGQMGRMACREGDLASAAALCGEALTMRRTIGHKPGMLFILDQGFLELAVATGQPVIAARILGSVEAVRKAIVRPREPTETHQLEPYLMRIRTELGEAAFGAAWAEGEAMSLEQVTAYVLDTLSVTTVTQSRPELRVFMLGQGRVYRGDRLLDASDWTYAKARELFFYLLVRPNVTREQIGLDFWPDASAEQVRKRLSAALAHARNALGRDHTWITLQDGRYRIDLARTRWLDVEQFEASLHAANELLRRNSPPPEKNREIITEIIAHLEAAIKLYQGDFIEDILEGDWQQARRAALLRAYLEALLTLGRLLGEAERYPQAIAAYRQALAKDPYLEDAHHELIRCYARSQKRSQALRQFEQLTAALDELGATPSPETVALVAQLRRGDAI